MPIIAPQHSWKDSDHVPSQKWPDDCRVQWGGPGKKLRSDGTRHHAFFEAFPKGANDAGFIRANGATIAEAEEKALAQHLAARVCAHRWCRGSYNNGGTICCNCGAFQTGIMKPVHILGHNRRPLSEMEINAAIDGELGYTRSHPSEQKEMERFTYTRWLRLRHHGIDLPPIPEDRLQRLLSDELTPFGKACRDATCRWLEANPETMVKGISEHAVDGHFPIMTRSAIRFAMGEWYAGIAEAEADTISP